MDSYEIRQARWLRGMQVQTGDKLKVLRKAKAGEAGWSNCWSDRMKDLVGSLVTLESPEGINETGILTIDGFEDFFLPYFVLQPVGKCVICGEPVGIEPVEDSFCGFCDHSRNIPNSIAWAAIGDSDFNYLWHTWEDDPAVVARRKAVGRWYVEPDSAAKFKINCETKVQSQTCPYDCRECDNIGCAGKVIPTPYPDISEATKALVQQMDFDINNRTQDSKKYELIGKELAEFIFKNIKAPSIGMPLPSTYSFVFEFKDGSILKSPEPGEDWERETEDLNVWPPRVVSSARPNYYEGQNSWFLSCGGNADVFYVRHQSGQIFLHEYGRRFEAE